MKGADRLFWRFTGALFVVMSLFGLGMLAAVLFTDEALALRMINVFAGMFSGVLGLGTGYLLGSHAQNGNGNGNGEGK
jgi:succinate dehydrogenase hydrophobic anchor subunit